MVEGLGEYEDGAGQGNCDIACCWSEECFLSSARSWVELTARVYWAIGKRGPKEHITVVSFVLLGRNLQSRIMVPKIANSILPSALIHMNLLTFEASLP